MAVRLGDDAPNFTATTTDGTIDFPSIRAKRASMTT